jgi:TRAP transporter TAXI family solute receptor
MKKVLFCLLAIGLVASLVLIGCAPAGEGGGAKKTVTFATLPTGSSFYVAATAVAEMVPKYSNLEFAVVPTGGVEAVHDMVDSGQAQIGIGSSFDHIAAASGLVTYDHVFEDINVLLYGHNILYVWAGRADKGINTVADLKGKRVLIKYPYAGSVSEIAVLDGLRAHGLELDRDYTALGFTDSKQAVRDVLEGRADAFIASVGGAKWAPVEASGVDINFFGFTPKEVEFVQGKFPGIIAAGTKPSPPINKSIVTLGHAAALGTLKGTDEKIIYTFVKTVAEHAEELHGVHPILTEWNKQTLARPIPFPYHKGAVKYYKEAGLWTDEINEAVKGYEDTLEAFIKLYGK